MRPYSAVHDRIIGRRFSVKGPQNQGAERDQKVSFLGLILAPLIGGLGRINRAQNPLSRVYVGFRRPCYAVTGRKIKGANRSFSDLLFKTTSLHLDHIFMLADCLGSFLTKQKKSIFESINNSSQLRYHILHSLFFMMQNPLYMHV